MHVQHKNKLMYLYFIGYYNTLFFLAFLPALLQLKSRESQNKVNKMKNNSLINGGTSGHINYAGMFMYLF